MASKRRVLERAEEIMRREGVDAEKAWALAVAQLTLEDEAAAKNEEDQKKQLHNLIQKGDRVVRGLEQIKDNLESEANEDDHVEDGHTEKTP